MKKEKKKNKFGKFVFNFIIALVIIFVYAILVNLPILIFP